jgi:hypothetical protein
MLRAVVFAIAAAVLLATPVRAQRRPAEPANPLASVQAFRCTFTQYAVARWDGDVPTMLTGDDTFRLGVTAVDLRRSRARIVAESATVEASAILTPTGLNVIEQTPGGNFILTTIFTATRSPDTYYAVHARHLGDPAAPPSASQYHGTCEVATN